MNPRLKTAYRVSGVVTLLAIAVLSGYQLWRVSQAGTLHTIRHFVMERSADNWPDLRPEYRRLIGSVSLNDLERLSIHPDPFARLMAGICIVNRPDLGANSLLERLKQDPEIFALPYGCTPIIEPVGAHVERITNKPDARWFLLEQESARTQSRVGGP